MDDAPAVGGGVPILDARSLWVAEPPGMVVCGLVLVVAGTVGESEDGAGETGGGPSGKVTCPACGARNDRGEEACHYCGAALVAGPHERQ